VRGRTAGQARPGADAYTLLAQVLIDQPRGLTPGGVTRASREVAVLVQRDRQAPPNPVEVAGARPAVVHEHPTDALGAARPGVLTHFELPMPAVGTDLGSLPRQFNNCRVRWLSPRRPMYALCGPHGVWEQPL